MSIQQMLFGKSVAPTPTPTPSVSPSPSAQLPAGSQYLYYRALDPNTPGSSYVGIVDLGTATQVGTINVEGVGFLIDDVGMRAYYRRGSLLCAIDLYTNTEIAASTLGTYDGWGGPPSVAGNPSLNDDRSRAYWKVYNSGGRASIAYLNTSTFEAVLLPIYPALNNVGGTVVLGDRIFVIDGTDQTSVGEYSLSGYGLTRSFSLGGKVAGSIISNASKSRIYVGSNDGANGFVTIINTTTNTIEATVQIADINLYQGSSSITVDSTSSKLYVNGKQGLDRLYIVDLSDYSVTLINNQNNGWTENDGISLNPNENYAYYVEKNSGTDGLDIFQYNLSTQLVTKFADVVTGSNAFFGYAIDILEMGLAPTPTPTPTPSPSSVTPTPTPSSSVTPTPTPTPSVTPSPSPLPVGATLDTVGFKTNSAASEPAVVNKPDNISEGDLIFVQLSIRDGRGNGVTATAPTGFTLVGRASNNGFLATAVYMKTATASEPATYSFALNNAAGVDGHTISAVRVSNANAIANVVTAVGSSVTFPTFTATANRIVLSFLTGAAGGSTSTTSGPTLFYGVNTTGVGQAGFYETTASSGSVSNVFSGMSSNGAGVQFEVYTLPAPTTFSNPYDPSTLLTNTIFNTFGVMYDVSRIGTLWQDAARTIPVTAVGQPVGCIDDVGPVGLHLKQTTSGFRGVLGVDANGRYFVQMDGIDDWYVADSIYKPTAVNNQHSNCYLNFAVASGRTQNNAGIMEMQGADTTTRLILGRDGGVTVANSTALGYIRIPNHSAWVQAASGQSWQTPAMIEFAQSATASAGYMARNGTNLLSSQPASSNMYNNVFWLNRGKFFTTAAGDWGPMQFYGAFMWKNAAITGTERTLVQNWSKNIMGIL